jgi:putative cell wall-binding protein
MKHYAVTAQFGHVGRGKYIPKTIAILAESGEEAAEKVRWMPRVKHHRKDAIIDVRKISEEEYQILKEENRSDPYFKVNSKQEQEEMCDGIEELVIEYEKPDLKQRKIERDNKVKFKMKKQKIIHNEAIYYMRNYEAALAY